MPSSSSSSASLPGSESGAGTAATGSHARGSGVSPDKSDAAIVRFLRTRAATSGSVSVRYMCTFTGVT